MTSGVAGLKLLSRKSAIQIALILALALLWTQWAAQAHSYTHLSSKTVAAPQIGLKEGQCSNCLSFEPLLTATSGFARPTMPAPQVADAAPARLSYSLASQGSPAAFRSRAPPYNR